MKYSNDCTFIPGFSPIWTEKGLEEIKNTKHDWTRGLFVFSRVAYQPTVLFGWIGGVEAREMEKLTDEEITDSIMFVFDKFLQHKFGDIPRPIRILPSRWNSNPHFRGTYSSRTMETDKMNASAYELSVPLNNSAGQPVILFAGEATSPLHYTLSHGAIETGYREADRLRSANSGHLVMPLMVVMAVMSFLTISL